MICAHASSCGGCTRPEQPYQEQLRAKAESLRALLASAVSRKALPPAEPLFLPVPGQTDDPVHFRQKVAFVFGEGPRGRLELGHYARGSRRVVPVEMCPVHNERGNAVAFALRDRLRTAGVRAEGPNGGVLRHLIVRVRADGTEEIGRAHV